MMPLPEFIGSSALDEEAEHFVCYWLLALV